MKARRHYRGGFQCSGQKAFARELRKNQTAAEEILWRLLRNRRLLGFKFRRQHQFGDYIADFYCCEANLVIECDGAAHEPNERWHHDQERDAYMISQGLKVLRFSNDQVLADTANVIEEICQALIRGRRRWRPSIYPMTNADRSDTMQSPTLVQENNSDSIN